MALASDLMWDHEKRAIVIQYQLVSAAACKE
jgi:hypothetical protein